MNLLNKILLEFKSCFSRTATFEWFIIIIIGLILRTDKLEITFIIRDFQLKETAYDSLTHFFHSKAWNLESLTQKWVSIIFRYAPLLKFEGYTILVADGVK